MCLISLCYLSEFRQIQPNANSIGMHVSPRNLKEIFGMHVSSWNLKSSSENSNTNKTGPFTHGNVYFHRHFWWALQCGSGAGAFSYIVSRNSDKSTLFSVSLECKWAPPPEIWKNIRNACELLKSERFVGNSFTIKNSDFTHEMLNIYSQNVKFTV